MRASSLLLAVATALVLAIAQARVAEEVDLIAQGARLASQSCTPCHAVRGAVAPGSAAPAFSDIARMGSTTSVSIKVFLKTSHAPMPNIMLTEREIDALTLYILSLGTK